MTIPAWRAAAFFLILASAPALAQIGARGSLQIDIDIAKFFGDEQNTYVEVYYGVRENCLTYTADSGGFRGLLRLELTVRSETAQVSHKEWLVPHIMTDTSRLSKNQVMTGLETLALPPGSYACSFRAKDLNAPARADSASFPIVVAAWPKSSEAISDLELATGIQSSSNRQSLFYKNTLEVTPNPSRLFGSGLPVVYYYAELYNLGSDSSTGSLIVRSSVIDAAGVESLVKDKPKARTHKSSVEIGTTSVAGLRGGTYTFRLALLDSSKSKTLASSSKKFFVYRPGTPVDTSIMPASAEFSSSEYPVMTPEETAKELEIISYLMNDFQKKQAAALTDIPSKQRFLFEFWKSQGPDAQQFKAEYKKRASEADKMFVQGLRSGWKSDRGRVYMLYGPPNEIERFPNSAESNAYEIWHDDNVQGGVIFVFVDRNNTGDVALVHSTHRNELQDPNWYQDYALKALH